MIKLTKEDKLMILALILVLGMVTIFLTLEVIEKFRIVSDTEIHTEIPKNTLEELYNQIILVPKNNDSANIHSCVDDIFEKINNKDYENLYSLLLDDFKEAHFPNLTDFEIYMEEKFGDYKYSPSFSNYQKFNDNIYVLTISYLPEKITDNEMISNNINSTNSVFSLYIDDENNYKFSFLGYIGKIKLNTQKGNEEINVALTDVELYNTKTIFTLKLTNNTEHDMFIGEDKITCQIGARPVYYPSTVWVPNNSDTTIKFTIYTGLNLFVTLPTHIYFTEIIMGDMVYSLGLPITYPIDK